MYLLIPQISPIIWTIVLIITTASIYQIRSIIIFEKKELKKEIKKKEKKNKIIKW